MQALLSSHFVLKRGMSLSERVVAARSGLLDVSEEEQEVAIHLQEPEKCDVW